MGYWNGVVDYSSQYVSDYAVDKTQQVSDAFTRSTQYVSDRTREILDENIKWGQDQFIDMIQTASLTHNLMESTKQSMEAKAEEDERLRRYGDPSKDIKDEAEEEDDTIYYPKSFRKYV